MRLLLHLPRLASIMMAIGLLLAGSIHASAETVRYTLEFWLNADQLRERMGLAKYVSNMPDVFVALDIGDKGRCIPGFIERQYKGQLMLVSFDGPKPSVGEKILVNFYADHGTANHVWNKLLQTNAKVGAGISTQAYGVRLSASGEMTVQLADRELPISPPEFLYQAELSYPLKTKYKLEDKKTGVTHGEVKLSFR